MFFEALFLIALLHSSAQAKTILILHRLVDFEGIRVESRHTHNEDTRYSYLEGEDTVSTLDTIHKSPEEYTCEWLKSENQCTVSYETNYEFLKRLNSPLAKVLNVHLTCGKEKTKSSCSEIDFCGWDRLDEECGLTDYSVFKDSPCVKAAPGLLHLGKASGRCLLESSPEYCERDPDCDWNKEKELCRPDMYHIFFGKTQREFNEIINTDFAFYTRFDPDDPDFVWGSVLDWNPEIECSYDVSPQICGMISPFIRQMVSHMYYCGKRYRDQQYGCDADVYCQLNENQRCVVNDHVSDRLSGSIGREFPNRIENPTDRKLVSLLTECRSFAARDVCLGDKKCFWIKKQSSCDVDSSLLYSTLFEAGDDPNDPVCQSFSMLGDHHCDKIDDEETCNLSPICVFSNEVCDISNEKIGLKILAGNDLWTEYKEVVDRCHTYSTPEKCSAGTLI